MLVWALTAAIVLLVMLIVWLLRPNRSGRGGQLDLTPAAARGELDLSWDDPRPRGVAGTPDGSWHQLEA